MASTTWVGGDSGNETDWNTGANWSTGSIPTTSAHVVIANTGHNCALDTTRTIGSLTIQASATIVGGGNRLIIQSEGDAAGGTEHYALKNDGIVSGNLHLEFTYAGETAAGFNGSSGNFNDIKLNAASVDLNQVGVATFDSLIIVANATYDAGNDGLTISGDVSCTGIFLGNSTTTISHGSLTIASGGTYTATSGTTTITSETSGGVAVSNSGTFTHNSGTVSIETPAATFTSPVNYNNLIINHASAAVKFTGSSGSTMTIAGDLTITQGSFENNISDANLTVTGDVSVTGTLTGNSGAMTFGSLTIESGGTYSATSGTTTITGVYSSPFALSNSGTFTNNDGTLLLNRAGNQEFLGTWTGSSALHDLTIDGGNGTKRIRANMLIEGDLDVTASDVFTTHGNTETITVDGDVTVSGTLGATTQTGDYEFGSLTIASGGTYIATSGTTTITGETASHAWKNDESDGTGFVHNNGLVHFDYIGDATSGSINVKENVFYDLEISLYATTYSCSLYDGDGSNAVTILNNLDVTKGEVEFSTNSDTITIHGLTNITANAKFSDNASHDTNKIIHNGLVTNLGTYNINDGTTVKLNGGIRQLGTLTVK